MPAPGDEFGCSRPAGTARSQLGDFRSIARHDQRLPLSYSVENPPSVITEITNSDRFHMATVSPVRHGLCSLFSG